MPSAKKLRLVAENPPPRRETVDWWAVSDWCRKHPGTWYKFQENGPMSRAVVLRQGVKAFPWDEFEMRTTDNKKNPPRTCTIYLRFVGKNKEHA